MLSCHGNHGLYLVIIDSILTSHERWDLPRVLSLMWIKCEGVNVVVKTEITDNLSNVERFRGHAESEQNSNLDIEGLNSLQNNIVLIQQ